MDIIQRDKKYFLQLANGELELTEQQVKKRVERGDKLHEYLKKLEKEEPQTPAKEAAPKTAQSFITSGKYFDNLIREFEQIYRLSEEKEDAAEKLIRFCKNAINKLHHDRKNPKTDHVVIDYYILSWSRVISFIQSLSDTEPEAEPEKAVAAIEDKTPVRPINLTKQLLIIQLMQADGLFPISDALQGVNQDDVIRLIAGILNADIEPTKEAMQASSTILLKRDISPENKEERIKMLEDVEAHFEELPYSNIISRVKVLLKVYRGN
jgi:hypothetical protein